MTIDRVYLMTWLQRTTIHLQEMYHFFTHKYGLLGLDPVALERYAKDLAISDVTMSIRNDFEVLKVFSGDLTFSAAEDGIFTLSTKASDVVSAKEKLEAYYKHRMGPALAYLFGRGAPLPKELSNLKEIYPILVVVRDCSEEAVDALYQTLGEKYETIAASRALQIFFGQKFLIVRIIRGAWKRAMLEEILANIVFLREFEKQLSQYLNLHRTMWDEISAIRESRKIRYKDFPRVRRKIMDFLKTLFFVKARLNQMGEIDKARLLLLNPTIKRELKTLGLFRFDNALADQDYVRNLWDMTIEYVDGTLELLESLFQESAQRELSALKFITLVGALAGFFGMNIAFPWEERWSSTFPSSIAVVTVIVVTSFACYYLLRSFIYNRYFAVREKE